MTTNQSVVTAKTKKRKKIGRNKRNTWFWGYFFVAPLMIGLLIFSVGPVISAFYISLLEWDGLTDPTFVGLSNYVRMFQDPGVLTELLNTLKYTAAVVPITIAIATIIASLLNAKIPGRSFFRVAFYLPNVTMPVAIATVWRWLFNSKFGLVNLLFRPFGLNPQWLGDPNYIMKAVIIVAIWSGIGYAAVILLAGMQNIPRSYYEAASIDGAGTLSQFWHITVPLLTPTLFFLLITSLINGFKAFDIVFMFSGAAEVATGSPTTEAVRTMVYAIYQKGFTLLRMGYAAAEAVLLFLIIFAITAVQFYFQRKFVHYE